jgi:nucleoside-diphosphate-sugar epimerase
VQDVPRPREADLKAAVTGATGFVGSHLVEALVARGDGVTALVRQPARAEALRALGCRLVEGGLGDGDARLALVDEADVVFHVAGLVAARSEAEFLRVNRDGTADLAATAARAGLGRLVLVSSLAVTGPSGPGRPVDEVSGAGPVTAYGRSKRAGEEAVRAAGVAFTIVRPPAVYGPRDRGFLPLFRMAARGVVPLLDDGGRELTLVHAADLARALVAAATGQATLGGTYHAGHAERVTQRALAEAVSRAVGRPARCVRLPAPLVRRVLSVAGAAARAFGRAPLLDGDKANELLAPGWACSSEALRRDAGWAADIPLERGLTDTARDYRQAGWL